MKFTKERPIVDGRKWDGYVWYVDIEYPIPKIGFFTDTRFFDSRWNQVDWLVCFRFGDPIEAPKPVDNEIEGE
jgi:hypothetical protein